MLRAHRLGYSETWIKMIWFHFIRTYISTCTPVVHFLPNPNLTIVHVILSWHFTAFPIFRVVTDKLVFLISNLFVFLTVVMNWTSINLTWTSLAFPKVSDFRHEQHQWLPAFISPTWTDAEAQGQLEWPGHVVTGGRKQQEREYFSLSLDRYLTWQRWRDLVERKIRITCQELEIRFVCDKRVWRTSFSCPKDHG